MASTKPAFVKLGVKPEHRAAKLHAPADAEKSLGQAPEGCRLAASLSGTLDFILAFYESEKALKAELPRIRKALPGTGMAWVCWRKGNVTDLSRDTIALLAQSEGLEAVSSCAINDNWSALKLMYPKEQRAKAG